MWACEENDMVLSVFNFDFQPGHIPILLLPRPVDCITNEDGHELEVLLEDSDVSFDLLCFQRGH